MKQLDVIGRLISALYGCIFLRGTRGRGIGGGRRRRSRKPRSDDWRMEQYAARALEMQLAEDP